MSKRKLLLADDSITIQKVVNLTFADEGIEVISVSDGNSAMDKLREDMPDLIMADVNMPGLNGYEICEIIKQAEGNNRIPVILLVGSFEPFDEEEAKRVGADDYLKKPFQSISQLVEKVNLLLKLESDESLEDLSELPLEDDELSSFEDEFTDYEDESTDIEDKSEELSSESSGKIGFSSDEFDDEMIQTDQIGSVPIEDNFKFESAIEDLPEPIGDEIKEDEPADAQDIENNFDTESLAATDKESEFAEQTVDFDEEDLNKTQPLTDEDYHELAIEESSEQTETIDQTVADEAETQTDENISDEVKITSETENSELPTPEYASILDLDELNLLDLPPLMNEEERTFEPEAETSAETSDDRVADEGETTEHLTETSPAQTITDELEQEPTDLDIEKNEKAVSSEMVEEVTRKVVERLTEQAVREIAWEVVPDMAELIIKKMAEEKMKE